jgi:hypothetical protein
MKLLKSFFLRAMLALAVACGAGPVLASTTYHVSIDTSTLSGQSGYLDFLFLGLGNATAATAQLSKLSGNFTSSSFALGDASGSTASGIAIANGSAWNEFGIWANFGALYAFDVSFDLAPDLAAGTTLSVALLDDQFAYLGTSGDIVTFALQPGLADTVTADSQFAAVSISPVPEPSSVLLMIAGMLLLAGVAWRRSRAVPGADGPAYGARFAA